MKGPRFITHIKRLRDVTTPLANFLASGIFNLREKLGPVLWQLPPNFTYDAGRLEGFLDLLPGDTSSALRLARRHDFRLKNRARPAIDMSRPLRHAIEIRNESFRCPGFIAQLRRHGVALVVAETAGKWPMLTDVTADFMYLRLHGDQKLYASGYGSRALDRWARRIVQWHKGREPADAVKVVQSAHVTAKRDVFCYFDNTDIKLRAPVDAQALARKIRMHGVESESGVVKRNRPVRKRVDLTPPL